MDVKLYRSDDLTTLETLYHGERNAKQRDRCRVVLLALSGLTEPEIRERVDRSRTFIQKWVYAYRDHGVRGLAVKKPTGQPTKLPGEQELAFLDMLAQADRPLRGVDIVAILKESFGVVYTLQGAYDLLHRLEYVPLKPRPVNPKKSPDAEQQWKKDAPLFVQSVQRAHPDKQVEVWFQDESRFGQKGCLSRVWAKRGSRPVAPLQSEYEWIYLYGAVNPETGESVALVLPWANTTMMQLHLDAISQQTGADRHIVLVLDNAGWHRAKALKVPQNITLLHLPPYSPELNPMERVWHWLKDHEFSNRVYADEEILLQAVCDMWNTLDNERIKTVCHCSWTHAC